LGKWQTPRLPAATPNRNRFIAVISASLNHPNKGGRNVKCVVVVVVVVVVEPSAITFLKQWLMYPKFVNWFSKNMANEPCWKP